MDFYKNAQAGVSIMNEKTFLKQLDEKIKWWQNTESDPHGIGNAVIAAISEVKSAAQQSITPPEPELSEGMWAFEGWYLQFNPGNDRQHKCTSERGWRAALVWASERLIKERGCSEERTNVLLAAAELIKP